MWTDLRTYGYIAVIIAAVVVTLKNAQDIVITCKERGCTGMTAQVPAKGRR